MVSEGLPTRFLGLYVRTRGRLVISRRRIGGFCCPNSVSGIPFRQYVDLTSAHASVGRRAGNYSRELVLAWTRAGDIVIKLNSVEGAVSRVVVKPGPFVLRTIHEGYASGSRKKFCDRVWICPDLEFEYLLGMIDGIGVPLAGGLRRGARQVLNREDNNPSQDPENNNDDKKLDKGETSIVVADHRAASGEPFGRC